MIKTRDFILLLVTIVFLLLATGATVFSHITFDKKPNDLPKLASVTDFDYEAEIINESTISRADRLEIMRQKIANSSDLLITNNIGEGEIVNDQPNDNIPVTNESISSLVQCQDYAPYPGVWSDTDIFTAVVEGSRIFYTETTSTQAPKQNTSLTVEASLVITRDLKLQLPQFPQINTEVSCVRQDVIGVANQGSLIRNNEVNLYGLFSEDALLGYALDGWPIYGSTERDLDECGGAMLDDGYRYYLNTENENILNCFRSTPVSLIVY